MKPRHSFIPLFVFLIAFGALLSGATVRGASIVKVTYKQDGKVVARSIYSGDPGGATTDREVYWKLLRSTPMFGSEVKIKPAKAGGKVATLEGKIEVSIEIRNKFNKGVAKTDKLTLIRDAADSEAWYLSKAELERLQKLAVGGDEKQRKKNPVVDSLPINAEAKALLEAGKAAGKLPEGVVIRVSADLFHATPADPGEKRKEEAKGIDFDEKLEESWEFSDGQVHRTRWELTGKNHELRRVDSRPFDSSGLCRDLLDGKILAIELGEAIGEPMMYVGTDFDLGGRAVEVLKDGEALIEVGEGCVFGGYFGSDARAFAELYEKLAKQAQAAFSANETTRDE